MWYQRPKLSRLIAIAAHAPEALTIQNFKSQCKAEVSHPELQSSIESVVPSHDFCRWGC